MAADAGAEAAAMPGGMIIVHRHRKWGHCCTPRHACYNVMLLQ